MSFINLARHVQRLFIIAQIHSLLIFLSLYLVQLIKVFSIFFLSKHFPIPTIFENIYSLDKKKTNFNKKKKKFVLRHYKIRVEKFHTQ